MAAKRDPHRDFRAADLQEQPTKPVESRADFSHGCFVGFDEDGGSAAKIAASGASRRHSERQRAEQSNFGSRAAVLRTREGTRFSSPSEDEVGGCQARSARNERQRAKQSNTVG